MKAHHWRNWLIAAIGTWILASPSVLVTAADAATLSASPLWMLRIVSLAIVAVAVAGVFADEHWQSWVAVALGLWVVASPWLLYFSNASALRWNAIVMGAAVAALAGSTLIGGYIHHGHLIPHG